VPTWPSAGDGGPQFTYVQKSTPENPEEGETWYKTDTNEAKVYDGAAWQRLTVTDHGELGGVSVGQHRSDSNVRATVDGQVDADTVDGQHAGEIGVEIASESGSGVESVPDSGAVYVTVSFANTYSDASAGVGVLWANGGGGTNPVRGGFWGWDTDGSGNITGMTVMLENGHDATTPTDGEYQWNVMGKLA